MDKMTIARPSYAFKSSGAAIFQLENGYGGVYDRPAHDAVSHLPEAMIGGIK
ncbi:MAG: hypothetical protein ACLRSW_10370 [Christensenellaceae bacterium]